MPTWIPINWELAGNWYNWVVIVLMLTLAMLLLAHLFPAADGATQ